MQKNGVVKTWNSSGCATRLRCWPPFSEERKEGVSGCLPPDPRTVNFKMLFVKISDFFAERCQQKTNHFYKKPPGNKQYEKTTGNNAKPSDNKCDNMSQ